MAAVDVFPKEVQIQDGREHTVLSDVEEGDSWPASITWITICDRSESQLLDIIQAITKRDAPQRVSIPGCQQFVGVLPVDKICNLVDTVMKFFAGTKHQVVIPTLRYIPVSFMYWEDVFAINKFIWTNAVAYGYGVLNLHRNFMARQTRHWVVHGPCYAEFSADQGLGATMSLEGVKRYEARLLRLHTGGFDVEHTPSVPNKDEMPLPLWSTTCYVQSRSSCEILESLGYRMEVPKRKRKAKGPAKEDTQGVQQDVVAKAVAVPAASVAKVSRGEKRGRSLSAGPEPKVAGSTRTGKGRGRGRAPRDSSGNVICTVPMEAGTVRAMVRQITELKAAVEVKEKELQRARKDLALAEEDVRRKENVVAVYESRARAESRAIRREREQQYQENQDWLKQRQEWREERKGLMDLYEQLHAKHHELKGQFAVFREIEAERERKEKKLRKERRQQ